MTVLILFAFIGGIVTILSPCILPLLPIVLSSSVQEGKKRPLGIITGFILSFTFFTLFLSSIVRATGVSADLMRTIAALTILVFGLTMVIPRLQSLWENFASRLANKGTTNQDVHGFKGGVTVGISLGLVWTPCVGPILASIITLAATASVSSTAILITLAYAVGTAIPMLALVLASRRALATLPFLKQNSRKIQQIFGILMILTAIAIQQGYDRNFQSYVLEKFPNYGAGLTSIEDTEIVSQELDNLKKQEDPLNQIKNTINNITNPQAPELVGGVNWINSEPLQLSELKGKVVLVDFWTYSCINCIRTLPYLKSWHEKYQDDGLVIIGVHSPEFEFEKSAENVIDAAKDFGIEYPIVQDNNFDVWKAYDNSYWPAKYLIDKDGRIRYTHFGEGAYDKTEDEIRKLLTETGSTPTDDMTEIDEFSHQTKTPETYLGYWRIANFASLQKVQKDQFTTYTAPNKLQTNQFAYSGSWMIGYQHSEAKSDTKLELRFDAKDVHLVMRPTEGSPTIKVLLDGKIAPDTTDVKNGIITLDKDRLYTLINLETPGDHTLTIEFPEGSVEVFAFTFG